MAIAETGRETTSMSSFWLGLAAYLLPTFPIAYVWHLVMFAPTYDALGIYRPDPIIPFGFASMVIQGIIFSRAYPRLFPGRGGAIFRPGLSLRIRAGGAVVVVHDARRGRKEHHELRPDLSAAGDGVHAAAVCHCRGH